MSEIELKLSIAPEDVPRLARVPLLKSAARERAVTTKLYSVYYDTPEFELQKQGAALRLRRAGTRWIQTLKCGGQVEGGLHQREEFEIPLPAQILNCAALAKTEAVPVLSDPQLPLRLQPVFVTDFKRTTRQLRPHAGSHIEFCLDRGTISAHTEQLPLSEIELELKSGPPAHLLDFAVALLEHVPLRLESASKAERGYGLAKGSQAQPMKAGAPDLSEDMSVPEALRAVVFSCVAQLQANERGLLESDDAEYLHQARVALRRLRSAFSVFNRAFPRSLLQEQIAELRWLGTHLGEARDWDVFALETLPAIRAMFADVSGLTALAERSDELRASADQNAREAVGSTRYTALLLGLLGVFLREPWTQLVDVTSAAQRALPLAAFTADVLTRRHKKVLKAGRRLDELTFSELHALRIEIKKLRYATDFFSALYDKKQLREYVGALAGLQELLGGLNDAATVERLLQPLRETPKADADVWSEAIGVVRGAAVTHARGRMDRLPAAWEQWKDCPQFWK